MKNQNGMGNITLIICIVIIAIIIINVVNFVQKKIEKENLETVRTDMISIQTKVKIIADSNEMNKDENTLKGILISESDDERINKLKELGIIPQDEEQVKNYYVLDREVLNEMKLTKVILDKVIVNYSDDEIILLDGIKIKNDTYYKLSDIKNLNIEDDENENKDNEINAVEDELDQEEISTEQTSEE